VRYTIENVIIDLSSVQQAMERKERESYLLAHPYKIWQGTNGKWYTYLPEKVGRVQKQRSEDLIVSYYKAIKTEPTLDSVFHDLLAYKLESLDFGRGTYERYINDYKRFFIGSGIENQKFTAITEDDLESFIRKSIVNHDLPHKAYSNLRILIFRVF